MRFLLFALSLLFFVGEVAAQYIPRQERGDPVARRKSNFDANNLRATAFNFGFSGRTAAVPNQIPYEWPKFTNREYIALIAMFVGGEVIGTNGDTIHIVNVPNWRQNPSGGSWNFEPVPQYTNPSSSHIARSDDPSSWPAVWIDKLNDPIDPGWPGSWNSF